jgi:hypothetical protein
MECTCGQEEKSSESTTSEPHSLQELCMLIVVNHPHHTTPPLGHLHTRPGALLDLSSLFLFPDYPLLVTSPCDPPR